MIFTRGLGIGDDDVFDLGGIVSAIIGVVIVLLITTFVANRLRHGGAHGRRGHAGGYLTAKQVVGTSRTS